jgi:hypothetical protein
MLDLKQAEKLVAQLQKAEDRGRQPIDPTLPLELMRVRRETERTFAGLQDQDVWSMVMSASSDRNLVSAGLTLVARWFSR